jgi:hypothetical protein
VLAKRGFLASLMTTLTIFLFFEVAPAAAIALH